MSGCSSFRINPRVALMIPAPIRTTSVFERIVVSGIAKILKYKDTFKIAKKP
jgi:hypothetical protein